MKINSGFVGTKLPNLMTNSVERFPLKCASIQTSSLFLYHFFIGAVNMYVWPILNEFRESEPSEIGVDPTLVGSGGTNGVITAPKPGKTAKELASSASANKNAATNEDERIVIIRLRARSACVKAKNPIKYAENDNEVGFEKKMGSVC